MSLRKEITNNISELKSEAQNLLDANLRYYKLLGCKISSKALGLVIRVLALAIVGSLALIFLSVAAGFALGYYFQNHALGFLTVGGIYILIAVVIYLLRKVLIDMPVLKKISKIFN